MNYRMQEVKVGLMVVLSGFLLLLFLFIVSDFEYENTSVKYTTKLAFVGGFEEGTPVRLGGQYIGRIADIRPPIANSPEIELVIEIDAGTPIKTDSRAYLTSLGFLGEFYLEIMPGSPEAPLLPPDSEIPSLNATTFSQLAMPLSEMAESFKVTITQVNELFNAQNQQGLANILTNLNSILTSNSVQLSDLLINLNQMAVDFSNISSRFDTLFMKNEDVVDDVINNLSSTLAETQTFLQELTHSIGMIDGVMAENTYSYKSILANLERSTRNLEEFSRNIRERPWNLVRKSDIKARKLPKN